MAQAEDFLIGPAACLMVEFQNTLLATLEAAFAERTQHHSAADYFFGMAKKLDLIAAVAAEHSEEPLVEGPCSAAALDQDQKTAAGLVFGLD